MARLKEAQGDLPGALALLDEAQRVYTGDFSPNVRPVPAVRARAARCPRLRRRGPRLGGGPGLSADDELSYLREYEHVTLARVLLARHTAAGDRDDSARGHSRCWQRLLAAAEAGGRTGTVIEILVLQALAHQADGDTPRALAHLERALSLAEPEGYVRVFAAEGPPMAVLLRHAGRPSSARAPTFAARRRVPTQHGASRATCVRTAGAEACRRAGPRRAAERPRAGGPAAAVHGPGRSRHRTPPGRVPEHRAHPHQEHLRQARRQQPAGGRHAGRRARPAASHTRALTADQERPRPVPYESPRRSPHVVMSAHHIAS